MRIAAESFRGEAPRVTPRALPENGAQTAVNARLQSGDLESWRQLVLAKLLANPVTVETIYKLNDQWLSWSVDVDAARGAIPGDNTYRLYLTAPDLYAQPRFTNYALATTGAEPFPVTTRPLGVPAPDSPPALALGAIVLAESNIVVTNPGAEAGAITGWTVDTGALVVWQNGDVPGLNAQAGTYFFGGGSAVATEAYQDIDLTAAGVLGGQGLRLVWQQATGAAGSTATMRIEFYNDVNVLVGESSLPQFAPAAALTWERREMTALAPADAVTARLVQHYVRVGAGPDIDAYIDTITFNSVEYTNYFDGASLTGWNASSNFGTAGSSDVWREVTIDGGVGVAPPAFLLRGDEATPWINRNFSTENSPTVTLKFDFHQGYEAGGGLVVAPCATAAGLGSAVYLGTGGILIVRCGSWDDSGALSESLGAGLPMDTWYTVTIVLEQLSSTEARVTVDVRNLATNAVVVAGLQARIPVDGPNTGFKASVGGLEGRWWIDNVYVTVAPPEVRDPLTSETATSYVYTFVNDLGEESAPSAPSDTILRPAGGTGVVVTLPTDVPSGIAAEYAIQTKRIYRAVTGNTGTEFLFVAEIPLAQAEYTDTLSDNQLGDPLETELWDLPPDDLRGILALPNGIMVGFRRNQLCFSAQNRPHAWPVEWRLNTDTNIVAIGNIDNTVVIGTEAFPYLAVGNDPAAYSMSKLEVPQACVSKQSLAYLTKIGVVFASPDGLIAISGNGQVSNLTEMIFTRRQWQDLTPESVRGIAHDDVYHFFTGSVSQGGAALTPLFSDDMTTDTNALLENHTPQIAPAGFSQWALLGFGQWRTDLGVGATANDPNDTQVANIATLSVPMAVDASFAMQMEVDSFIDGESSFSNEQMDFYVSFEGAGDTVLLMRWRPGDTLVPAGQFTVIWNGVAIGGTSGTFTVPALAGDIPRTIIPRIVITPTSLTLSGVGVDPYVEVGDFSWMMDIHHIYLEENNLTGTGGAEFRVINLLIESVAPIAVSNTRSYMLDMKPSGFGLVELGYHATAAFADPLTDQLYLVLDAVDEPSYPYLPLPSMPPEPNTQGIFEFDSPNAYGDMVYRYKSKLNLLPRPGAFTYCKVKADDYLNLAMNIYGDGDLIFSQVITSKEEFTLPMLDQYETFEVEFIGTSRVHSYQFVEDVNEMT